MYILRTTYGTRSYDTLQRIEEDIHSGYFNITYESRQHVSYSIFANWDSDITGPMSIVHNRFLDGFDSQDVSAPKGGLLDSYAPHGYQGQTPIPLRNGETSRGWRICGWTSWIARLLAMFDARFTSPKL